MNDYQKFLERKKKKIEESGFEVNENDLNPALFDFQRFNVKRALKAGRYAIFADCGLGKTLMQLEFAYQVSEKENARVLILCPLAVSGQTIKQFGLKIKRPGFLRAIGCVSTARYLV